VNLVNLDGTTIFGAGSEWFWSMAQFFLLAGSILGIYFQLRAQRASALFDQTAALSREWIDESFLVHRLAALVELEARPIESGLPSAAKSVGEFFDRIGFLVARKHLHPTDVSETLGGQILFWWGLMRPYVLHSRVAEPTAYRWFERLDRQMRALNPEARDFALEVSDSDVRRGINELTEELRRIADARNGIYPTPRPQTSTARET